MNRRRSSSMDQEISSLTAQVDILRRREAEYEKLLEDLQRLKVAVSDERFVLEAKAKNLEDLRKPINWLPNELLAQIFLTLTDIQLNHGRDGIHSEETRAQPSIIVSHVCHRWRQVALSSPHIWSKIDFRSSWSLIRARTFIERSGIVPIDIHYRSSPNTTNLEDSRRTRALFVALGAHLSRLRFIEFQSSVSESVKQIISLLNNPDHQFKQLHSLSLSIISLHPTPPYLGSLLGNNHLADQQYKVPRTPIPEWSHLTHLKFEEIPLFNLPYHFIANLVSLELGYLYKKIMPGRKRYYLRMTAILHFLSLASMLEELTLTNTVPRFDVVLPDGNANVDSEHPLVPTAPVRCDRLKVITWSFPCSDDVHRFMAFIDAPALERFDLWIENQFVTPKDLWHRNELPIGSQLSMSSALVFPSVRFLSLQCPADDSTISVMRKFAFPMLESFELTNVDKVLRDKKGKDKSSPLPSLPRIESIFRDPRLFHLTHFTLSRFRFSTEHSRAEAVLGYMPFLTSLCFDSCSGVGKLLSVLDEQVIGSADSDTSNGSVRRRRGVKVCPRLEALSFWGCNDLEFMSLRAIVLARNGDDNGDGGNSAESAGKPPNGAGVLVMGVERKGKKVENQEVEHVVPGRKIKPLRKPVRQLQASGVTHTSTLDTVGVVAPSNNIVSSMIAAQEAFRPAQIVYIRIQDCSSITDTDAAWLRDHDVSDVMWKGTP